MRFWDTSAIVPLIVKEETTGEMQRLYKVDREIVVWALTYLEILSALCRRRREGKLSAEEFSKAMQRLAAAGRSWHEVASLPAVRRRARRLLMVHPLRAADALQLAAALVAMGEEVEGVEFLTFDLQLRRAAEAEGFAVQE
jgi:hypothetical protein